MNTRDSNEFGVLLKTLKSPAFEFNQNSQIKYD